MSQLATPANTWTCSQGGTWTVTANGADVAYYTYSSMVGFKGASNYPKILANVTSSWKSGPDGGTSVAPGEFYYHPTSSGTDCIRYTTDAEGTFAVTGVVRRVNSSGGDGIRLYVYADGVLLTNVVVSATDKSYPFAVSASLLSGATLDVRLDANSAYNFDATGLKCHFLRTGPYRLPIASSAADALRIAAAGATVSNPVERANGKFGRWSFLHRSGSAETLMSCLHVDKTVFRGVANTSSSSAVYPRLLLNTSSSAQTPTDATANVAAGEMYYHPDAGSKTVLRYTVERTGHYGFSGRLRDVNTSSGNGVHAVVTANGNTRTDFVLAKGGDQSFSDSGIMVIAGNTVELVLDSNGSHAYDATALSFDVTFEEARPGGLECALMKALRENVAAVTPSAAQFTASDGGVWSFGHYGEGGGLNPSGFQVFTDALSVGNFRGWCLPGHAYGGVPYPHLAVLTSGTSASDLGYACTSDEVAHHPFTDTYTVFRFHAPSAGLYTFSGRLTAKNTTSSGTGLDASVIVRGAAYPASGYASASGQAGTTPTLRLAATNICLAAGETLDLAIGPNGSFNNDASTLTAIVTRENDLPSELVANFDICGTARAPYVGAGRLGLADGLPWTRLAAGSTVSACPVVNGVKRQTRLTLSRAAGSAAISGVPAAIADGVESASDANPVTFTVTGLVPGAAYAFCAYSRNASGEQGVFTVGAQAYVAAERWFARWGGDVCTFTATADANGAVSGTFAGTAQGAATFTALQIAGAAFPERPKNGFVLVYR